MSLFTSYRHYPQLSLCTALLIGLGFLGAIFYLFNSDKNQQAHIERYGQLLATSTARQAVDATLTQDMISLQAILQETAQYPNVIGATLHNIDNKLLVQSGYKPKQASLGKRYNFAAPVALHNNVAGYMEVTIEMPRRTKADEVFLITWGVAVSISLFLLWWSMHRHWWSSLRDKMPSAKELVTAVVDQLPHIEEAIDTHKSEVQANAPAAQVAIRLSIHVLNLTKLYQQLNSETFSIALRRFDKQMQNLLNLYNGQRQPLTGDVIVIDFAGEEFHECTFRAVCCAQILLNMAAHNPSPKLQLAAAVQPLAGPHKSNAEGNSLLKDFIVQYNNPVTPSRNEILVSTCLIDSTLLEHAEFDNNLGKLIQIKAPFCDYLAKQEEQLLMRS